MSCGLLWCGVGVGLRVWERMLMRAGMMYRSTCGARACLGWTLAGGIGMSLATLSGQLHTLLYRQRFQDLSLGTLLPSSN